MVREGKANKSEWQPTFELLEYCAKTGMFVKPLVLELLTELNLTLADVRVTFR